MTRVFHDMRVSGDPDAVDSFAACLDAVLKFLDRPADYASISALAGTCFAPCHNRSESCVGWMVDVSDYGLATILAQAWWIGDVLGADLQVLRLPRGAPAGCEWRDQYRQEKILPPPQVHYFKDLKDALDREAVVITGSWPAWSILCGWSDDLEQLPFITTPGFEETVQSIAPPSCSRVAVAVLPAEQQEVDWVSGRQVLEWGAQVAAGVEIEDNSFGPSTYSLLAGLAHEPHLCPECQQDTCFSRAARRILNGQQAAVDYLKMARAWMPDGVHGLSLENLVEAYGHMQLITRPYTRPEVYAARGGDPAFREQLFNDFMTLQRIQIQAGDHFQALVED